MILRDYQLRALDAIREGWKQFRRQYIVMGTGLGKTVVFAEASRMAVARGKRVLVLAASDELTGQAIKKIEANTGIACGREQAEDHASLEDKIVVATVQTMSRANRLAEWPKDHFDLIIVDECHHVIAESYKKILAHFDRAFVLGVSATPDRGDKRNLAEIFESMAFEYGLKEGVEDGWLVRPMIETVQLEIDLKGVRTARTAMGSDYNPEEVGHKLEPLIAAMCAKFVEKVGRRKAIVYLPSVHLAEMAAAATLRHGVAAQFVSGACDNRVEKIQWLREGIAEVTYTCGLLTEGFDDSGVSCVSLWSPTKIRSKLAQCFGRGTRPADAIVKALNEAPDAAARRAIIADSRKPDMLFLDFLFLTDDMNLMAKATDLVIANSQIAAAAKKKPQQGDLLGLAETVTRDFLKSIEDAVRRNARKKARVIDPLALAVMTGDRDLETYEPDSEWEMKEPSKRQIGFLYQLGINGAAVTSYGMAQKWIGKLMARRQRKLCMPQKLRFLTQLKIADAASLTDKEASAKIDARLAELKTRDKRSTPEPDEITAEEIEAAV